VSVTELILTGVVVPVISFLLYLLKQWVQVKLGPQRFSTVMELAQEAVIAAEKYGQDNGIGGYEKFFFAQRALETAARRVGVKLKPEETTAFIHALLARIDAVMVDEPLRGTTPIVLDDALVDDGTPGWDQGAAA
jgi:hypothetical protein